MARGPRLGECASERLGRLRPADPEPPVDDEERDAPDPQFGGLALIGAKVTRVRSEVAEVRSEVAEVHSEVTEVRTQATDARETSAPDVT